MLNSLFIGNKDGGIINTITQAPQSGEPVVVIGLGGTGVDAAARLKSKLRKQIIPDNAEDVKEKGDEPRYNHIKFLGIDADIKWLEASGLSNTEILNIQNYNYTTIFSPDKLPALKKKKEMQWMSIDYMATHLPPNPDGAGAYRQFGRWLTVASANNIKMKLTQVITSACIGRIGGSLNVHIISSVSGGMGAGSFVDVCYIVKEVLQGLGFDAAKTFGYFVLPDAIISKDSIIGAPIKTANNQKNGMAALLEIEHLMNLKDSNEWFEQDYDGFSIRTQEQLVDMCHFVSATNTDGVPVPNGYEYSLNVIGDYILAFVSKEQVAGGAPITMKGNLANINADLAMMNPDYGYSQNYHLIGAANAEIPTSQMATYLASELFKKLTIRREMPQNVQIEEEFAKHLKLSDGNFKQLENQISQKASYVPVSEDLVKQYFDQIKAHMNDNILPNALIGPTENSLRQRKGVLLQNREHKEKPVEEYTYQAGASSVPGEALNQLIRMIEDPTKGPIYAYGMMNKTGADIFHYLDGRLKYYSSQKQHARNQEASFIHMEPSAKQALGSANFLNKGQRIKEYTEALNNIYHWQAEGDKYEEMEILISSLISTFRSINTNYLRPLYEVTKELIETFEANSTYFDMGKGDESQDGFTKQLVKFSSIKPELDAVVKKLDPKAETKGLLQILTTNPDVWMEKEELKLKAAISQYVLEKFDEVLSGSIESFLRKELHMEAAADNVFTNAIETNVIKPFVNDAAPIFWTSEPLVSNATKTSHRSVLTVPNIANCVCQAADNHKGADNRIEVRKSLINDRVYILRTISGVPMHGYQGLVQYKGTYDNYTEKGLHLHEQDENWRKMLTFPYPYNYVQKYTKNADSLLEVYKEAEEKGVIYFDGTNAYVKRFAELKAEDTDMSTLIVNGKYDFATCDAMIATLEKYLENPVEAFSINSKGNQENHVVVVDNFLRFYGVQEMVKAELQKYNLVTATIAQIRQEINKETIKIEARKTFFDALLTGCFEDDAFNMSYTYVEFGMEKKVILCDNSMPYAGLSKYYQAFEKFVELDSAVYEDLKAKANGKFNAMTSAEKRTELNKLMAIYTPPVLAMISNNFKNRPEQGMIDGFYREFDSYMRNLDILLKMAGV